MLDYADVDYLDIYTNGPLKYREASEKNATLRNSDKNKFYALFAL